MQAELREATIELEQQRLSELRMQQEMAAKAEAALANEEQFSNVQQEVEMKTKKLKKLWAKFQEAETTLKEEREAFQVNCWLCSYFHFLFEWLLTPFSDSFHHQYPCKCICEAPNFSLAPSPYNSNPRRKRRTCWTRSAS